MTHNLVLDLDVGVGQIHIQLCITGTASDEKLESQQSTKEIDWNEINAKYVSLLYCMSSASNGLCVSSSLGKVYGTISHSLVHINVVPS